MAGKSKNIFLFLALACFIGIILIFVFDGYIGLYDTAKIVTGEFPQTITPEQWQDQEKYGYGPSISVGDGDKATFSFKIDNRRFSSYNTEISVSLWRNQEKIADILNEPINIRAFGNDQIDWTFDTTKYIPDGVPANASLDYSLIIQHGDIERKVVMYVFDNTNKPGMKIIVPPNTVEE